MASNKVEKINEDKNEIFFNKTIILGITGSIAAYKSANICSSLIKKGAKVFPIMTPNATNFINPITLSTISGNKTVVDMFENHEKVYHVSLPQSSDLILIAPASANTISKIANGICDNFLTTAVFASNCPVLIAPAMNEGMWLNFIMQENINKLSTYGNYFFSGPSEGKLACKSYGVGRLEDEEKIIEDASDLIFFSNDLKEKVILVTAGGTREFIDSVRYISNYSSGKMGYALAAEAKFRGAKRVILISTTKNAPKLFGVETYYVNNTPEMKEKILEFFNEIDLFIMTAAVSDIIPLEKYDYKLKKEEKLLEKIKFKENENILEIISSKKKENQIIVGFAAESSENIDYAKQKLLSKNIDMIVLNDISRSDIGFDSEFNEVTIIDRENNIKKIAKNRKRIIAREIINEIVNKFLLR